jgi:hypothetical protein
MGKSMVSGIFREKTNPLIQGSQNLGPAVLLPQEDESLLSTSLEKLSLDL